ncbi:DUF1963 domain-containing protein [Streptomyces sp. NPDC051214]|uniref:DUF1963 domain-containing protein n=1 Tax=Streptomyces sp. NPDC051214 TaxID=3155282 RepID=UPI003418FA95
MTRRTPPRPVDVERLFPEVVRFKKDAVRLHPRAGDPTYRESSIGGPLLWPAREPWPVCAEHGGAPMVAVAQIYRGDVPDVVAFPEGCDVLQVLWCPRRHHDGPWVVPRIHWRAAADVRQVLAAPPLPAQRRENYVPRPCVVHPERVTEYPSWDLDDTIWDALEGRFAQVEKETGWDYQYHLSTAPGTKLGGFPGWGQDPQPASCTRCGRPMEHLLTFESAEGDAESARAWTPVEDREAHVEHAGMRFGDMGGVYLFECLTCPDRPNTHRVDCA